MESDPPGKIAEDFKQGRLNFRRLENFVQVRRMKLVVIKEMKMFIRDGCHWS